jgi:hypothetical protein
MAGRGCLGTLPPILPGSIREVTDRNLARAAWAVLFFPGPRRQTTLGIGPEGTVRTAGMLGGASGGRRLTAPERRYLDRVSVSILAIHLSLLQD